MPSSRAWRATKRLADCKNTCYLLISCIVTDFFFNLLCKIKALPDVEATTDKTIRVGKLHPNKSHIALYAALTSPKCPQLMYTRRRIDVFLRHPARHSPSQDEQQARLLRSALLGLGPSWNGASKTRCCSCERRLPRSGRSVAYTRREKNQSSCLLFVFA